MLRIDPAVYPFGALLILTIPLPWLLAAFFSATLHEMAHIAAILILDGSIQQIEISICTAKIYAYIPSPKKEFICALAGPLGSLIAVSLVHLFPRLAICALIQGVFNLLPVYPLDGGRALYCLLQLYLPEQATAISARISNGLLYLLLFFSVGGEIIFSTGPIPVAMILLFLYKRKKTCKQPRIGIQ